MVAGGNVRSQGIVDKVSKIEFLDLDSPTKWVLVPHEMLTWGKRIANVGPTSEIAMSSAYKNYYLHPTELTMRLVDVGVNIDTELTVAHAQYFPH